MQDPSSSDFSIGVDLGSVAVKAVVLNPDGGISRLEHERTEGPLAGTIEGLMLRSLDGLPAPVRIGITGGGKALFGGFDPALIETDVVSTARAIAAEFPEARGLIEVGGHRSKWIRLGERGALESFSLNDQCAAGSGAFLEQQAGRLGIDIEELSHLAASAPRAASIAGRCAVFAKSDMIHQQQKGTPVAEVAYGLCLALARNFRATLLRGTELVTPIVFLGGGALNPGLVRAFREVFELSESDLMQVDHPLFSAAHGVALAAHEQAAPTTAAAAVEHLISHSDRAARASARVLAPLRSSATETAAEPIAPTEGAITAYLGVDIGSVSTNFCLLSRQGEVLDGIYLATRGDPVAAMRRGLSILRARVGNRLDVLGVGTTGSGRYLAGDLLGADVVKNEITCQLSGAKHVLPEVDTILEIGGQDSKYVAVRGGRIDDFVMNKICAAGTGSFLEEQSEALGVSIRDEFAGHALHSDSPADLGSQCTVFMDTEVVNERQRHTPIPDIASGLAYSVAKNYLERVVAGKTIGSNVVFQGGVASNKAVVAAFEELLGRPVAVHPFNRISGAIGAAFAARDEMKADRSAFRGLEAINEVDIRSFECKSCSNICQVSRIRSADRTTYFGDTCERFTTGHSGRSENRPPDLFSEVEELLLSYAGGDAVLGTAGVPRASVMYDQLPFWAKLLRSLGFRVVVSGESTPAILEEGLARLTAETCLPIKLAYGHVASLVQREDIDFVFLPSIMDLRDCTDAKRHLCPFEESVGYMVSAFAAQRMLVPAIFLASPRQRTVRELVQKFSAYNLSEAAISRALDDAWKAQAEFEHKLRERGREVLSKDFGVAFTVLGKPYNILDRFQNLDLVSRVTKLGILPIPMQMMPRKGHDIDEHGVTIPWSYNRNLLQSLLESREDRRIFPIVVSNFGCGPDAFGAKYMEGIAQGTPYLYLEFDEHRGEAGLVTRLEAFVDEISGSAKETRSKTVSLRKPPQRSQERFKGRRFVLPHFADHAWAYYGALRFADYEVLMLPPPDDESLAHGEDSSSGKECHPYIILAGDLIKHIDNGVIADGDVFLFPGTQIPCLLSEYSSAMRLALDRRGVEGVEVLAPSGSVQVDILGMPGAARLGRGLIACEHLTKLKCRTRPYAKDPAQVDALFDRIFRNLGDAIADDRIGDVLRPIAKRLDEIAKREQPLRPVVGVAGDMYTRINTFGNRALFRKLEDLGIEVWPAPFLIDVTEFGWRRAMSSGLDEGRYFDAAGASLLLLRKEMEALRIRLLLGNGSDRADEPSYQEILSLASPYVDRNANNIVVLNVAKMVDFARRGAHGIVNAISFHCMLGTVSAALAEKVRRDHDMIPLTTLVYTGKESPEIDTKLEAFAHQVHAFAQEKKPADQHRPAGKRWLAGLLD